MNLNTIIISLPLVVGKANKRNEEKGLSWEGRKEGGREGRWVGESSSTPLRDR
jgi:hypothetical protein